MHRYALTNTEEHLVTDALQYVIDQGILGVRNNRHNTYLLSFTTVHVFTPHASWQHFS